MKKLVCLLALVAGLGIVAFAQADSPPAPETEPTQAAVTAQESAAPVLEPLEDQLRTKAWTSCSPSCSSLRGDACTIGTFTRCYHTCFEPDICTCPDGTWNCP